MTTVATRFRQFQTPRITVVVLLLGLGGQGLARRQLAVVSAGSAAAILALDSAIAAAKPVAGDTSGRSYQILIDLVSQKRDIEVNAQRSGNPWLFVSLLCGGLVLAAIITGAQALWSQFRGDA